MGRIPTSLLLILFLGIHSVCLSDILQRQKRDWIIETFDIEEENKGPFPYILGTIKVEKKYNVSFELYGQGVDKDPKNILEINTKTGVITVHGKVDYEEYRLLKLTFEAHDVTSYVVGTRLGVEVLVSDINDNPPIFEKQTYEVDLKESATQGTYLISVIATDKDNSRTSNGTFDFRIVSVSPEPTDMEFYIKQSTTSGTIEFKGCLDYEETGKYIILVEAKDRGEKVQFSSTCTVIVNIIEGNNHMPVFTGQTGPGSVKEGEENVTILRLQVSDRDTEGTEAWKATYKINGDSNNNFEITTDPKTNEGVLNVKKHLNYEDGSLRNLSVTVENEAPYYSCTVRSRTTTGLWDVVTMKTGLVSPTPNARSVTVNVEDLNEPPVFIPGVKDVRVGENLAEGHYLETFIAKDMDGSTNSFVYMKGEDPCDWIKVDPKTGRITTTSILDRESPFVKDNVYQVTLYAVDNGEPPMTGTATLNIHLKDQNDNVPNLDVSIMDMCLTDAPSLANITAFDLDEDPFGGPFHFKLLGDVKDRWRLDPNHGYSVNLVKEKTVYAGHHELLLQVFDLQGQSAVHNLSVIVCNCETMEDTLNCHLHRAAGTKTGIRAVGIGFIAVLLLLGVLLLALQLSCKRENKFIPDEGSADRLINFNTETPGTDCKVDLKCINQGYNQKMQTIQTVCDASTVNVNSVDLNSINQGYSQEMQTSQTIGDGSTVNVNSVDFNSINQGYSQEMQTSQTICDASTVNVNSSMKKSVNMRAPQVDSEYSMYQQQSLNGGQYQSGNALRWSATMKSHNGFTKGPVNGTSRKYSTWGGEAYMARYEARLGQRLYTLQAPGKELRDYAPYPYAEEGDPGTNSELDAISIPEIPFDTDMLLYLSPRFNTLASICRPDADTS